MRYYPLLLDLHDKTCLVVGTGRVGIRKITTLLKASPRRVVAVDSAPPTAQLQTLANAYSALVLSQRPFAMQDLDNVDLAFVCTSNRALNQKIATECTQRRILCNITDAPNEGDVILPSLVERGDLLLTLSTSGKSPALCKKIRQELDCHFGQEYETLLVLMGRIRSAVLAIGEDSDNNAACFRALVNSSITDALRDRDTAKIQDILQTILPAQLHPSIGAMIHDIFSHL
ncbi:MAG: bifunctional precorrin-2 dehydrogenase/sirohydrochlorin ferrochelatase [Desulfoplanes sp.]